MKKINSKAKINILKGVTILSVFISFLINFSKPILAEVIFEDNFDNSPDWQS
jgi:hypothetical protein